MLGSSLISILPTGLILVLVVLYVALQPSRPERKPLPSQRLIRIAVTVALEFVVMVIVILRFLFGAAEWLRPTSAAEGSIPPIGWARSELAAHSGWTVAIVGILVVLALIALGAQYVARRTFTRRTLGLRLDSIGRTTGAVERVVFALGAVIVAGVGEEVIFRALLPAILYALTSSIAVAVLVPLLLFSVLHYDQGYRGILNAALLGAVATIVFIVTQQLWWSIALHAVANMAATVVVPEIQRARIRRIARSAVRGQVANATADAP